MANRMTKAMWERLIQDERQRALTLAVALIRVRRLDTERLMPPRNIVESDTQWLRAQKIVVEALNRDGALLEEAQALYKEYKALGMDTTAGN